MDSARVTRWSLLVTHLSLVSGLPSTSVVKTQRRERVARAEQRPARPSQLEWSWPDSWISSGGFWPVPPGEAGWGGLLDGQVVFSRLFVR